MLGCLPPPVSLFHSAGGSILPGPPRSSRFGWAVIPCFHHNGLHRRQEGSTQLQHRCPLPAHVDFLDVYRVHFQGHLRASIRVGVAFLAVSLVGCQRGRRLLIMRFDLSHCDVQVAVAHTSPVFAPQVGADVPRSGGSFWSL